MLFVAEKGASKTAGHLILAETETSLCMFVQHSQIWVIWHALVMFGDVW